MKTTSTTRRVLRAHRSAVGWLLLLSNLLMLALAVAAVVLWHMRAYAGGWTRLLQTDFSRVSLQAVSWWEPFVMELHLAAAGLEPASADISEQLVLVAGGMLVFLLLQGIFRSLVDAAWQSSVRKQMGRLTELAQEARRLSAAEARHNAQKAHVDGLQDAIHQMSPTQPTRLQTGDPDLQGLEAAINDLLNRMQAAYSQQSRFVSDASHELRTPIAVLKGYADLLERWGKDDPNIRDEAISAIQNEAQRMNRLVEQLLFLARGDSGRIQLQPEDLDLAQLVRQTWEESEMIDPGHRWTLDAPAPVLYHGDKDMLKQALRILSDNAAKYTPEGKEIILRAFADDRGRPCMAVQDEGMGIKAEDAAHVFDRFYRSDPARSRQSGGAGLGLSIADWIVTQHGGHIQVYSWEDVGSRFTIVLGS